VPGEPKPTEAEVAALLATADAVRKKPSRGLWLLAIVVSVVCVIGLAYGLIVHWNETPTQTTKRPASSDGSGFGLGLVIGIGVGIAIGSVMAMRRRQP
jgi:hypothetical protein